ncbi:hypothetical protein ACSNOH_01525 [Streptomyces sp. URMC 127]|uniref:hypothetical protein n=1 Tax=Streptomyces sp. URMC 127 TaxID=3423402 RepID=UPI003F1A82AB
MTSESGRLRVNLRIQEEGWRPDYPYDTEEAKEENAARDENDLGKPKKSLPNVDMSRHHIIPWEFIKVCWNQTAEAYYRDDDVKVPRQLQKFLKLLGSTIDDLKFRPPPRPEVREELKKLVDALRRKTVCHDPDTENLKGAFELLATMLCWTPGNLVTGPTWSGEDWNKKRVKGFRIDDPGDSIEPHLGDTIKDPVASAAIRRIKQPVEMIVLNGERENPDLQGHLELFYRHLGTLSVQGGKYLPQSVQEADWRHIEPGTVCRLPGGSFLRTAAGIAAAEKAPNLVNGTGRVLREVMTRRQMKARRALALSVQEGSQERSPAQRGDLDTSVRIGGTEFTLRTVTKSALRTERRLAVTGVDMGKVLQCIAEQRNRLIPDKASGSLDVPDFVRSLKLQQLSVVAEAGPGGWEAWQFTAAAEAALAGVTVDMAIYLECIKGAHFGLGALFACQDKTDKDALPMYFGGDFSKSGPDWELGARGGPYDLSGLVRALGINAEHLPPELAKLIPETVEAELRCRFTSTGTELLVMAGTAHVQVAVVGLSG